MRLFFFTLCFFISSITLNAQIVFTDNFDGGQTVSQGLTFSSWVGNTTFFAGVTGQALAATGPYPRTFTLTLNLDGQTGGSISNLSFQARRSSTGPTGIAVIVNGTPFSVSGAAGNGSFSPVSATGNSTIPTGGPITVDITFSSGVSTGTIRIDDFSISGALPIELLSFHAKASDNSVLLSFATAIELNNAYFSIERSQDGVRFETIGQVNGAGTSTVKQDYLFTDKQPLKGTNFYRFKQVDFDGQFSYSPVVLVKTGQIGGLSLFPQPALDQLRVVLEPSTVDATDWQVYDFAGRLVQSGKLEAESTNFEISTSALMEGTYVLRLSNGQQAIIQQFQKH